MQFTKSEEMLKVAHLPYSLRVLLNNLMVNVDSSPSVTNDQIEALKQWTPEIKSSAEIQFTPARVIMQDFTGVPCVVDLATLRDVAAKFGVSTTKINPLRKAQLVIDHSIQVDNSGTADALEKNVQLEYQRNSERYKFLKWGSQSLNNFEVVPPGVGIIHQVNMEYLADVVTEVDDKIQFDTCVGTDSHTTMVNGLGVLGWGVGGIEAEAALLGQPVSILIPQVIGVHLSGQLPPLVTATDLVLTITNILREYGVVGKFVEFFGEAAGQLDVPTRCTISNMCPEFGSTVAIFGIDQQTLDYLRLTGRNQQQIEQVEQFAKKMGVFGLLNRPNSITYTDLIKVDLNSVVPSIAGSKRPQDCIPLKSAKDFYRKEVATHK